LAILDVTIPGGKMSLGGSMDHTISDGGITAVIRAQGAELRSLRDPQGTEYIWQAGPAWPRCATDARFLITSNVEHKESDYDIAVFLKEPESFRKESGRLADTEADILY
jgi:hypothetical protein